MTPEETAQRIAKRIAQGAWQADLIEYSVPADCLAERIAAEILPLVRALDALLIGIVRFEA